MIHTISILENQTVTSIDNNDNCELVFTTATGHTYYMYHIQDCCEDVRLEEIIGDLSDIINSPILVAEERTNIGERSEYDTFTYTFYELRTINGSVTLRWYGQSNGFYSEAVTFEEII